MQDAKSPGAFLLLGWHIEKWRSASINEKGGIVWF